MNLINSFTFLIFLMTLTSCLDQLPEFGNEDYCPGIKLENGVCPSAKSKSLGWDFSNASNYSFNSNYVEVSSGQASLKTIDTNFSGSDFSSGSHVGTFVESNNLKMKIKPSANDTHVNSILSNRSSSLSGYWRFDNNYFDSSVNANHGQSEGSISISTNSKIGEGSALLSTAIDSVNLGNLNILDGVSRFSLSVWVYHASDSSDHDIFVIGNHAPNFPFVFWRDEYSVDRYAFLFTDSDEDYSDVFYSQSTPKLNNWSHLVLTFNGGSEVRFYVDGKEDGNSPFSINSIDNIKASTYDYYIGNSLDYDNFFDGKLDEVAIWNDVLTASDVFDLYSQQNANYTELSSNWTPHWNDIVGYWKMDVNWQDASGKGNHGAANANVSINSNSKVGSGAGDFTVDSSQVDLNSVGDDLNLKKGSINFWLLNEVDAFPAGDRIIFKTNFSSSDDLLFRFQSNNTFRFILEAASEWKNISGSITEKFPLNTWVHVVCTWDLEDTNKIKLFLNGKLHAQETQNSDLSGTISNLQLGQGISTTNFKGKIDEFSIFTTDLDSSEIIEIYNRQKQKFSSSYTSPIVDLASAQDINELSKTTDLPYMKELTTVSETTSDYSFLSGDLSDGLIGYWPLEESSGTSAKDNKAIIGDGSYINGPSLSNEGIIGKGVLFQRSSNQYLSIPSVDLGNQFTLSIWAKIKTTSSEWQTLIANISSGSSSNGFKLSVNEWATSNGVVSFETGNGTNGSRARSFSGVGSAGVWHHYVVNVDKTGGIATIYVDGINQTNTSLIRNDFNSSNTIRVGSMTGNGYVDGVLDELSIWNRNLSSAEIAQLYRRGANRVKYQVRTCSDSTCSTDPKWKGPGADGTTYFSELYNRAAVDLDSMFSSCFSVVPDVCDNTEFDFLATSLASKPRYKFSDFPLQNLNTRYFQYRVLMEAEGNTACSGQLCLPSVSAVKFETEHDYYASSPSIISSSPISITGSIRKAEHQISGGCSVKYQFSKDGANFFYYNLGSWTSATDTPTQANTIDQISSTLKDYITTGSLYLRAYLASDGSQSCNLSNFKITQDD